MKKVLIFLFLVLILVPIVILAWRQVEHGKIRKQEKFTFEVVSPRRASEAKIIGWTAYWDEENTLRNLEVALPYLYSFSPILYRITPEGRLGRIVVNNRKNVFDLVKTAGVTIIPVIGDDFDSDRVKLLLYDQEIQKKFSQDLVTEAKKEGFAGWDIDIESLERKDRDAFTDFISATAQTLHANDLKFSVVVFAKTGNDNNPAALAQDYRAIAQVADEVRLMVYGVHDEETEPGGQAPLVWVKEVLEYTIRFIPKEKIVVGLSTHGYDWGGTVEALTYSQIEERIEKTQASLLFDQNVSSAKALYQENGQQHNIWYENAQSLTQKIEMIMNEFGVEKFALWRVGAEDPKIWEFFK